MHQECIKVLLAWILQAADTSAGNTLHLKDLQWIWLGPQSFRDMNPWWYSFFESPKGLACAAWVAHVKRKSLLNSAPLLAI